MQELNVSKIVARITDFFGKTTTKLGRETKFVERDSKLTASLFVEALISASLSGTQVSNEEMCRFLKHKKTDITKQGLNKRFNKESADFIKELFNEALKQFTVEQHQVFEVLKPFSGVKILDSSGIELPSSLKELYKGYGGGASEAALKLQVLLDDTAGRIEHCAITSATKNDQSYTDHLSILKKDALYLQDLGYFRMDSFIAIQEAQAYFLSRYLPQTLLFTEEGIPFDLLNELRHTPEWLEASLLIGKKKKMPVRFIAQRVSDEIRDKRLKAIRKSYRRNQPSQLILELAAWSIYITNVPTALLGKEQIHFVYTLRWQIELFFKLCKHYAGIETINAKNPYRILCDLYARLITLVMFLHLCAPVRWQNERELSFPKAYKQLQASAAYFLNALKSPYRLTQFITQLLDDFSLFALKDKQSKKKQSSYQTINCLVTGDSIF
jgi:hypothetical protein